MPSQKVVPIVYTEIDDDYNDFRPLTNRHQILEKFKSDLVEIRQQVNALMNSSQQPDEVLVPLTHVRKKIRVCVDNLKSMLKSNERLTSDRSFLRHLIPLLEDCESFGGVDDDILKQIHSTIEKPHFTQEIAAYLMYDIIKAVIVDVSLDLPFLYTLCMYGDSRRAIDLAVDNFSDYGIAPPQLSSSIRYMSSLHTEDEQDILFLPRTLNSPLDILTKKRKVAPIVEEEDATLQPIIEIIKNPVNDGTVLGKVSVGLFSIKENMRSIQQSKHRKDVVDNAFSKVDLSFLKHNNDPKPLLTDPVNKTNIISIMSILHKLGITYPDSRLVIRVSDVCKDLIRVCFSAYDKVFSENFDILAPLAYLAMSRRAVHFALDHRSVTLPEKYYISPLPASKEKDILQGKHRSSRKSYIMPTLQEEVTGENT